SCRSDLELAFKNCLLAVLTPGKVSTAHAWVEFTIELGERELQPGEADEIKASNLVWGVTCEKPSRAERAADVHSSSSSGLFDNTYIIGALRAQAPSCRLLPDVHLNLCLRCRASVTP